MTLVVTLTFCLTSTISLHGYWLIYFHFVHHVIITRMKIKIFISKPKITPNNITGISMHVSLFSLKGGGNWTAVLAFELNC